VENFNLGVYGAKRQTWTEGSPRNVLLKLKKKYPQHSTENLAELLADWAQNHRKGLLAICIYWTQRNLISLEKHQQTAEEKKQLNKLINKNAKKYKTQIRKVVLMDLIMPNGKLLRDCTGTQCIRFGGWFTCIGKKVGGKSTVGSKLSETDLWKFYKQHPDKVPAKS